MQTKPLHVRESDSVLPGFYMTLPEAAAQLGLRAGQASRLRLYRFLIAREREVGRPIMVRRGGPLRPRLLITLPLLEEHCPELFARRVQLTEAMREEFEKVESEICLMKRQHARLAGVVERMPKKPK